MAALQLPDIDMEIPSRFVWAVHHQHPPTEAHDGIWERNRIGDPDLVREAAIEF